jgi:outer membrane receptor protein involved in Fe transport
VSRARPAIALSCFFVAFACLAPRFARAQGAPTFSVSVTEPFELVEAVGTTRRIGRQEIEARHARTLDEALRLIPGVHVRTGGDGTPRVDIRGFRSRHVLLLINGVLVNSTADGQFDPARIPTTAIREIKVSYSSSSLLYGDNALAAVIEITTIDGQRDATFELNAGTGDQRGAVARVSRTIGAWSMAGAATAYSTRGFRLPGSFAATDIENGGRRENSDRDRGELRGSLGYGAGQALSFGTEWSLSTGSHGLPPGTIGDPNDSFAQAVRYERVESYRAASGQLSVVFAPRERFNLRGWLYRNAQREHRSRYDDATYTSMDDALVAGTFRSRERTTITGGTVLGRLDLQRFGWLRLAVNQRREAFDSEGVIRDVPAAGGGGAGGGGGRGGGSRPGTAPAVFDERSFAFDRHVDVYSTGAEWQSRPSTRLGTVLGTGLSWQERAGADAKVEPTWIAGASYDATSTLRLHASATRKVRVPSIDQLYSTSAGNPALRPERAYGVDVGADQRVGRASTVGVSAFVTRANDFIERIGGSPFDNQGTYRFAGAEVSLQTSVIDRLEVRGAYTFLDSSDVTPGAANRQLQTRPRHRGSVEWTWRPVPGSSIRGAAQYVGRQLYDSRGSDPVQLPAGAYDLIDLGVTQALTRRYEVVFDVTNVFDRLYDQGYGLPREGRAALLTLRARFN